MKILIILNDTPYGTERSFNGLRLAGNLLKQDEGVELSIAMVGDAVSCGKAGQKVPNGYYSLERMIKPVLKRGQVLL